MRKFAAAVLLSLTLVGSVFAARNVEHRTVDFDQTFTFPLGPEAECFGVPEGTLVTVDFTGEIKETVFVAGPNAGRMQAHDRISVTFIIPSTGTRGIGREIFNFKGKDDDTVVASNVVHVEGTLADGTAFKAMFHGHFTMRDGEVTREIFKVNCIK